MKEAYNPHLGKLEDCLKQNRGLIYTVCNRLKHRAVQMGIEFDDMYQIASIGFIKAYKAFDPVTFTNEKGNGLRFSTYCIHKMYGELLHHFREWNVGPKFSRRDKDAGYKIAQLDILEKSIPEIAKILDIDEKQAQGGVHFLLYQRVKSMQETVFEEDDDDITLEGTIPKNQDYTTVFVEDFVNKLTPKQQIVVKELMNSQTSQEIIGRKIGVSQVQVGRIIKRIRQLYLDYKDGLPLKYNKSELKEFREGQRRSIDMSKQSNPANVKARELLKNTTLSLDEILERTGVNKNSLRTWAVKIRGTTKDITQSRQENVTNKQVIEEKEDKNTMKTTQTTTVEQQEKTKKVEINKEKPNENSIKPGMFTLTLSGDCKNVDELMEYFSKVCETIKTHNLKDFNFTILVKS